MEFRELLAKRRSIRKFCAGAVPADMVETLLRQTLAAPSPRNSRSTRLVVVDRPDLIARMADMRDSGSAFMKDAPLEVVVLGDRAKSDLWRINAAISATVLQLACVDAELGSCWVQVDGRSRRKEAPQWESAADYLRRLLPIPRGCELLCAVAIGYSDFHAGAPACGGR